MKMKMKLRQARPSRIYHTSVLEGTTWFANNDRRVDELYFVKSSICFVESREYCAYWVRQSIVWRASKKFEMASNKNDPPPPILWRNARSSFLPILKRLPCIHWPVIECTKFVAKRIPGQVWTPNTSRGMFNRRYLLGGRYCAIFIWTNNRTIGWCGGCNLWSSQCGCSIVSINIETRKKCIKFVMPIWLQQHPM